MGETLHGDYRRWMNDGACHSVTNYECYKGLYSSFNTSNLHEIAYSLNRQFGSEDWCLYSGRHLLCFADNHDVTRIASQLEDKAQLKPLYGLLFTMPGVPSCITAVSGGQRAESRMATPLSARPLNARSGMNLPIGSPPWRSYAEPIRR